ncbi:hypothetical protein HMPREF9120_02836, partial [Neisseria sp. oral taxon 020 str. F0370]
MRLPDDFARLNIDGRVSTHSRPKAAAQKRLRPLQIGRSFNTQPPEGGCRLHRRRSRRDVRFQHSAARRR